MSKLPVVSGKDLVRALEKEGFQIIRQRGSHIVIQKRNSSEIITTVVPNHSDLAKGTLKSILRKAKVTPEQLAKLLSLLLGVNPFLK